MSRILILLTLLLPAVARASGDPVDSFLHQNMCRALDVLERSILAHGGEFLLDRSRNLEVTYDGTCIFEAHYARPWAAREYDVNATLSYSASLGAAKQEYTLTHTRPLENFTIVDATHGVQMGGSEVSSIPEDEIASTWEHCSKRFLITT